MEDEFQPGVSGPRNGEPASPAHERAIESAVLFGSRAEVVIRHNGRDYRLRRTRLGKLILTA